MNDLLPRRPRFEGPVLAFVAVVLTGYACLFCWAWASYVVGT